MKINKKWYEYILGTNKLIKEIDTLTDKEVDKKLSKIWIKQQNKHNWEIYCHTGNKEYYDEIISENTEIDLGNKSFHAYCFSCEVYKNKYPRRNCLLCGYAQENEDMFKHETKSTPIQRYTYD